MRMFLCVFLVSILFCLFPEFKPDSFDAMILWIGFIIAILQDFKELSK